MSSALNKEYKYIYQSIQTMRKCSDGLLWGSKRVHKVADLITNFLHHPHLFLALHWWQLPRPPHHSSHTTAQSFEFG